MKKMRQIGIIISMFLIVIIISINYVFYEPMNISTIIASKIYKDGVANSAFEDENFYKCIIDKYNKDNNLDLSYDTSLSDEQLQEITYLKCDGNKKNDFEKITSVIGIEKLTNLKFLKLSNNKISEIDVSKCSKLVTLDLNSNKLGFLDVSNNILLEELFVSKNNLISLNVDVNTKLKILSAADNKLTSLDVKNNKYLKILSIGCSDIGYGDKANHLCIGGVKGNQISQLDVSNNKELVALYAGINNLKSIDISNNDKLSYLDLRESELIILDVSNNKNLIYLGVDNNRLTELDVSNNIELESFYIKRNQLTNIDVSDNIKLKYLGVDNNRLTDLDVSNNTELIYIGLDNNPFSEDVFVYKNENVSIGNNVKIANHLTAWKKPTFISDNTDIAVVNKENVVSTLKAGTVNMKGETGTCHTSTCYYHYTTTSTINVVEITSFDYFIDENKNFIYINTDNDVETIKNKINVSHKDVVIDINLEFDELYVKYNNDILKTYKLLSIDLGNLKLLDNKYILNGMSYDEIVSNIIMSDGLDYKFYNDDGEVLNSFITSGMELRIYYDNKIMYTYEIIDDYLLFDDSIKNDEVNKYLFGVDIDTSVDMMLNLINTTGKITITDNKNQIITGDRIIGTGAKIIIEFSSKVIEYYVVINGDVDGDGMLKLGDIMKIASYIYQSNESLSGVYVQAADYNKDNKHNLQDIMQLAKKIYG